MKIRVIQERLLLFSLFVFFSIVARFLLPIMEEPDFYPRISGLKNIESHVFWSPYRLLNDQINNINYFGRCFIDSSPMSILAKIDFTTCRDDFFNIINRLYILFVITIPVFLVFIFRKDNNRVKALGLSLIMPSIIYYLGLLSVEQFSLMLSLMCFVFFDSLAFLFFIALLALFVDSGNTIVLIFFIILAKIQVFISKKYGIKKTIMLSIWIILVAGIAGFSIFHYAPGFLLGKIEAIEQSYDLKDAILNKYPILFRPIITYFGFIFTTPMSIKTITTYVYFFIGSYLIVKKSFIIKKNEYLIENISLSISAISTILFFVFLLPTYANAKYYIFMLPFFFLLAISIISYKKVFIFTIVGSVVTFVNLSIYWV